MNNPRKEKMPSFHDATLVSIAIDWMKRECVISLRTSEGVSELQLSGLRKADISYLEPWGPSSSVNEVRYLDPSHLEIEVQNGDLLNFESISRDIHELSA